MLRFIIGLFIIAFYLITSIGNQIRYTFTPFIKSYKNLPYMLAKDDLGQLKELTNPIYNIVEGINKYPEDTNFYFVPCFEDSGNSAVWWWYLYIISRYFAYPRKIFAMDVILYNNNKNEYKKKFMPHGKNYSKLNWIKDREIKYIILFRNNVVSILSLNADINL